jgi:SAM-dependent methyltransferase
LRGLWVEMKSPGIDETDEIRERYTRRGLKRQWSLLAPYALFVQQEKERALARMLRRHADTKRLQELKCVEVGCGTGDNLLTLIRFGFFSRNLIGLELMQERAELASQKLPSAVDIRVGDAVAADIPAGSQDIVYASTVFTSILDPSFQVLLASRIWEWVRPGGAVLWYDFVYNNPHNPDVKGIRVSRVRELFPSGTYEVTRLTLAPPIGRRISRFGSLAYTMSAAIPALRTHVLCWITK